MNVGSLGGIPVSAQNAPSSVSSFEQNGDDKLTNDFQKLLKLLQSQNGSSVHDKKKHDKKADGTDKDTATDKTQDTDATQGTPKHKRTAAEDEAEKLTLEQKKKNEIKNTIAEINNLLSGDAAGDVTTDAGGGSAGVGAGGAAPSAGVTVL